MSPFQTSAAGLGAGRDARPADQERHLDRRVVGRELALVQAVLPLHEAVVRGEDQIGVAERALGRELVDDPLDRVVDREQRLEPVLVARLDLRDQPGAEPPDLRGSSRACP